MSNIYIDGFRISQYKSFIETQTFSDLSKINIIIGKNNSGKSNVLSWLNNHYKKTIEASKRMRYERLYSLDSPLNLKSDDFVFEFGVSLEGKNFDLWKQGIFEKSDNKLSENFFNAICSSNVLVKNKKYFWVKYETVGKRGNNGLRISKELVNSLNSKKVLTDGQWNTVCQLFHGNAIGGNCLDTWIPKTLEIFSPANLKVPNITFIPAIREIKDKTKIKDSDEIIEKNDFDGNGLIEQLANLQKPDHNAQYLKIKFQKINQFLQNVTNNKSAEIEIPASKKTITVHMDGKSLPIESLGTGIHEVVILAAASTLCENQIICMEEPEIHLHPTLQKKLIKYLHENTSNQYFIATHSVHLLDSKLASIYHIQLEDGYSKVQHIESPSKHSDICIDLGYRASDIIQSNCVIWVEGPSDRIYLNNWISGIESELTEGIHYSIMFYGGRLLSHLTTKDPEVDEFISLKRLNRNVAIVIDSDRKKSGERINATKSRIKREIEENQGYVWVTSGKEIENYISQEMIKNAIMEVHPSAKSVYKSGKYDQRLFYKNQKNKKTTADKVKVSRAVIKEQVDWNVDDLRTSVNKLVNFIKKANDIE